MRKASMVCEPEDWAFNDPYNVQIGCFGGERHCRGGERGLAVESGAGEHGAGQEMGKGFQTDFLTHPSSRKPRRPQPAPLRTHQCGMALWYQHTESVRDHG